MLKKFTAFLLIIVLCFNLCGCSLIRDLFNNGFDFSNLFSFLDKFRPQLTITFNLNYKNASDEPEPQKVRFGDLATLEMPYRESYIFAGWYTDRFGLNYFDFDNQKVLKNYKLYAKWIDANDTTDTDGDGLTDAVESTLKTSKYLKDTDRDGLSDYDEVEITRTNPLVKDTDDDGTSDSKDDNDNDGLSNKEEVSLKTNPFSDDTDNDGLSDYDECYTYYTNPLKFDTDDDGANDGAEVMNNNNPTKKESSFVQTVKSAEVSPANSVAITVNANVSGKSLGNVSVRAVSNTDNHLISSTIPGYMGNAYEISTLDGEILSSEIIFNYDTKLGTLGKNFQPRIYGVDDKNQTFAPLPNQTVSNGKVKAYTSSFTTYILLNQVAFDKVWETEIKAPIIDGEGNPSRIDAAFAIDVSSSMKNERISTAKQALDTFIDALDDNDNASIVEFNTSARVLCGLTNSKSQLHSSINQLNATGQTAMYTGFRQTLNMLLEPGYEYGYKMIVILSDGKDVPSTSYSSKYEPLVHLAVNNNIVVYTVGVGSNVDKSILERIATETGGSYYHATSVTMISSVFEKLQEETIDITKDSNGDKISDYFTNMILAGKLRFKNGSTQFAGYDFNKNADWDSDGLLNGEELIITTDNDNVYMKMVSNPLRPDSDADGITDKVEIETKSDPLKFTYPNHKLSYILEDDIYTNHLLADKYRNNIIFKTSATILNTLSGNWYPEEECQTVLMDYFNSCSSSQIDDKRDANVLLTLFETTSSAIEGLDEKIIDKLSQVNDIQKDSVKLIEALKECETFIALRDQALNLLNKIDLNGISKTNLNKLVDGTKKVLKNISEKKLISKINVKVKQIYKNSQENIIGNISTSDIIVTSFGTLVDLISITSDYASLNANAAAYEENIQLLRYLASNGKDDIIKGAAQDICNIFEDDYRGFANEYNESVNIALQKGTASLLTGAIISLANTNPYVTTIKLAYNILDLGFGISARAEKAKKSTYIDNLTAGAKELTFSVIKKTPLGYDSLCEDPAVIKGYLTHLAQLRIFGEKNYIEFAKSKGLFSLISNKSYEETEKFCNSTIETVKSKSEMLNITISDDFKK